MSLGCLGESASCTRKPRTLRYDQSAVPFA